MIKQNKKYNLQALSLLYFFLLPYAGYLSILCLEAEGKITRGWGIGGIALLGWLGLLVYQIFISAVNQTPLADTFKKKSPLFKGLYPLVAPTIMLGKQFLTNGNVLVFFIELTVIEITSLFFALYLSFIVIEKKWGTIVHPAGVLFFFIAGIFTIAVLGIWRDLGIKNIFAQGVFMVAMLATTVQHVLFFRERNIKNIPLRDLDFGGHPIAGVVGQIILWIVIIPISIELIVK